MDSKIEKIPKDVTIWRLLLRCIVTSFLLKIWTICAFRVLNPRRWSLAKETSWKSWNIMPVSAERSLSQKGWCNKPTKLQFLSILTQKILMLSKRFKSTEVDIRTWLHVSLGTHWSTSSDTHEKEKITTGFWKCLFGFCTPPNFKWLSEISCLTCNDISVIYVTAHGCAGGLKKNLDLRSGS